MHKLKRLWKKKTGANKGRPVPAAIVFRNSMDDDSDSDARSEAGSADVDSHSEAVPASPQDAELAPVTSREWREAQAATASPEDEDARRRRQVAHTRAINMRTLREQWCRRYGHNQSRAEHNGQRTPVKKTSRGMGLLGLHCALHGQADKADKGQRYADITAQPPPKFDLGPMVESSVPPESSDDPFGNDDLDIVVVASE